jgi:hypothetical protein
MKKDWVRIEDLSRFMLKEVKQYHPDDPRHTPYWRGLKRDCIEGIWREDFGQLRFMPGRMFFYGHFCIIEDTDEKTKTRKMMKPMLRDIEWERSYNYLEAEGFSGWTDDDLYTSDKSIFDVKKAWANNKILQNKNLFRADGKFKEYIPPRENIRMLHDRNKGTALYNNSCSNIMELGSRGGGKSYYYSLAGAKYRIVFDGEKYYTEESRKNPSKASILVGSGQTAKSSDFCNKVETSMNYLATTAELGAWGKIGDDDYEPSVFYKEMRGSIKPNNKDNKWRHEYEMNIGGRWIDGFGSGSNLSHVTYSPQKKEAAEAGAGGRYSDVYYEEVGLTEKVIEAYNSNVATVRTDSNQFGVQVFLGTSGNMETVGPTRKMFENPQDYEIISFPNQYENNDKDIAFFLPAYITNKDYKDEHGNTDVEGAYEYYMKRRAKAEESKDPSVLRVERMNYPLTPDDMWQTTKGNILPAAEAEERVKILNRDNLYQTIGTSIQLHWDSNQTTGVDYAIDRECEPFYEFPLSTNQKRTSLEGAIRIFDFPVNVRGVIPNDMYIFTHDPYVSDEWDDGGSLGVTHVWMNPKYWDKYCTVSPLVATYIGKAQIGKKGYYQNLEKLLAFYGNPIRGLWYEANRGEYCRGYFHKRKKSNLLSIRPQYEKGDNIYARQINQYGFIVGNKIAKIAMLDDLADFLLQDVTIQGVTKKVIETLPCIFSARQIAIYDLDGNFDAVSSMMGFPLYIREEEHNAIKRAREKRGKKNPLAFLVRNNNLKRQPA